MQKYSNIISGLKEISKYCDAQQFKEEPHRSFNICIGDLSHFFFQYINSQSEKPKASEIKLPNVKGEISKNYVDQEINDVKTIIEKKILGLNIYENKIEKINEDIRKQFDRKAAQFTDKTKQFQKILVSRMNNIQSHLQNTIHAFDNKVLRNLAEQQTKVTKTVDDKLKTMENHFTDDMQKLYKIITQLEKKNVSVSSPQKRQRQSNGIIQEQYQMNSSGVKFNIKRQIDQNRISTANRRNYPYKDNSFNNREQELRKNMLSQPKKVPEMKIMNSHIGSFGRAIEIKPPTIKNVQAKDWANEDWGSTKYTFDRNMIITKQPTVIFSKKQIKDGYSFCVSMLDRTFAAGLGIADSRYKRADSLEQIKPKFIYFADGDYWEGLQKKQKSGRGFKQQQVVTVSVNRVFGQIQWKVGGQLRFRTRSELISKQNYWVPFIFLGAKGATVGIAQE